MSHRKDKLNFGKTLKDAYETERFEVFCWKTLIKKFSVKIYLQ